MDSDDHTDLESGGGHRHDHHGAQTRVLIEALALNGSFFVVEAVGGLLSHSLALVADAGHMLSDAGALALALVAARLAMRGPTDKTSFGMVRAEILAALANGVVLAAIGVFVVVEAIRRLGNPPGVAAVPVLVLGAAGLGVNLWSAVRLRSGGPGINLRAAGMHMLADALGSVATIASGIAVLVFGWTWADPVLGGVIAVPIALSSYRLVREALNVLLEATPAHLSLEDVRTAIAAHPGVVDVHDVHVWTLTSGYVALSAHVVAGDPQVAQQLLRPLHTLVGDRFGVRHATLQVETNCAGDCGRCV